MKAEHETQDSETLPEILDGDGLPPTDPMIATCPGCATGITEMEEDECSRVRGILYHKECADYMFDEIGPSRRFGCCCLNCGEAGI